MAAKSKRESLAGLAELATTVFEGTFEQRQASLFRSFLRLCVTQLPYQVAEILFFDKSATAIVRYAAAFRRPKGAPLVFDDILSLDRFITERQPAVQAAFDATILSALDSSTDPFAARLRKELQADLGNSLGARPFDLNRYPAGLSGTARTATGSVVDATHIYNNLRRDFVRNEPIDGRYILAYETAHAEHLATSTRGPSMLRNMLVAPITAPAYLSWSGPHDGPEYHKGQLIAKLRLMNRTVSAQSMEPAPFEQGDAKSACLLASVFLVRWLSIHEDPALGSHIPLSPLSRLPPPKIIFSVPGGQRSIPIVGSSSQLVQCCNRLQRLATTDAPVLLYGESGVGKEALARLIHASSSRQGREPVCKAASSLDTESLADDMLFGHVRGAYTGATDARSGWFENADTSTLFLDDIDSLPFSTQSKLLRAIDPGEFSPLGTNETRHVNVRLIAATNQDLASLVRAKSFREDLFYRLDGSNPIRIPPLRDRGDDVLMLLRLFLESSLLAQGNEPSGFRIESAVIDAAARYRFPGNVRELLIAVEKAVTTTSKADGVLRAADFPETWFIIDPDSHGPVQKEERRVHSQASPQARVRGRPEAKELLDVAERLSGNKTKIAAHYGVTRMTVLNWFKSMDGVSGNAS